MKKDPIKSLDRKVALLSFMSIFLIVGFVCYATKNDYFLRFKDTGTIGDTIGGLSMPLISIISSFIIYFSFREQYKANQLLINENHQQKNEEKGHKLLESIVYDIEHLYAPSVGRVTGFGILEVMKKGFYERCCKNEVILNDMFVYKTFDRINFILFSIKRLSQHIFMTELYDSYVYERLSQLNQYYIKDLDNTLNELLEAVTFEDSDKKRYKIRALSIEEMKLLESLQKEIKGLQEMLGLIKKKQYEKAGILEYSGDDPL